MFVVETVAERSYMYFDGLRGGRVQDVEESSPTMFCSIVGAPRRLGNDAHEQCVGYWSRGPPSGLELFARTW